MPHFANEKSEVQRQEIITKNHTPLALLQNRILPEARVTNGNGCPFSSGMGQGNKNRGK